ncbi:MAG: DJ-1 family glyoxalase III [Planctomycetota bacterium]
MARVLIIVAAGAEETETMTVADILARAGQEVVIAGAKETRFPGSRQLPMAADTTLDAVDPDSFDLIFLPGGMPQAENCRDDARIQAIIARRLQDERPLAIMCASPMALLPNHLARGRRLTCFPALRDQLEAGGALWQDQAVVHDGCLITSQGPGTAMDLGLYLAEQLAGAAQAREIADQMLVPYPF